MKLLHTSDWHLGRSLHGEPMLEHQRTFLRWLVELAVEREVDAVLVAGDVYDRAVPPTDAVRLLDAALAAFARARVDVVITSGNHDSSIRLGFGAALAERAGVHLRTDLSALSDPVLLGDLAIYGIPYLLPDAVMADLDAERSHTSVLSAAVRRVEDDAAARGVSRIVVLAHAFVTGGVECESERDIRIGGIGDVPASVFTGITYTALGHLHGAQQIGPGIRYAGSPLPYSFSERNQHKSVALVDIDAGGAVSVELVPTPVPRRMAQVCGRLDDLLAARSAPPEDAWLRVVLTDPARPAAPMERLRERWPHTLVLDFQPDVEPPDAATDLVRLRAQKDPVEICALFVEWVDSTLPDRDQRDALSAAVEAVRAAERTA
jgi:DNA repair protein SbcD/Mre11